VTDRPTEVRPVVLSMFDRTGNMVRPWLEAGYDAMIVDMQHAGWSVEPIGCAKLERVGADVLEFDVSMMAVAPVMAFGFPPCTDLAISGARWFQEKGMGRLIDALTLVERCRHTFEDVLSVPYMIENPASTLSTYWRKPDHTFDPCDFGGYPGGRNNNYTKRTCLWTGNGFRFPTRRPIPATDGSRMHRLSPGPDRANLRAATPMGFARAVYEAKRTGRKPKPLDRRRTRPRRAPVTLDRPTEVRPRFKSTADPAPKQRKRIAQKSKRVIDRQPERDACRAAVRFLSCEPLLGPLPSLDFAGIDWVIVGAESGKGARPMHDDWVRDIRDRATAAGARLFFKQRAEGGRKISTPELDGVQWVQMPAVR